MQHPARRVRWLRSIVLPIVAAGLTIAAGTNGSILPGGGPLPEGDSPATDCFVYAEATGSQAVNRRKFLVCEDGDPACDQDGACNGTCRFRARVCPGPFRGSAIQAMVAGCDPPPPLDSLRLSARCPLEQPANLTGSVCGAFVDFDVPLKGRRKLGRGRARCRVRAAATVDGKRRRDSDVFVFACVPPEGGCPASPSGAFIERAAEGR